MATHFTGGNGALWAQIYGPNTEPVYLGCHAIGDIEEPYGDIELIYCPDPSAPNRFVARGSVQGAAGAVTTTITADVTGDLDALEKVRGCPMSIYVHMIEAGRKDVFTNWKRSFILANARITSKGLSNLSVRTPDDNSRSEQTFDLSAEYLLRPVSIAVNRQTISETQSINAVSFCNQERCRTEELAAQLLCQIGFAVSDNLGSPATSANVLKTTNGATWAATGADPFGTTEIISAIVCFDLGQDEIRVMVARGTTDAAAAAEVAYSDDMGDTWTAVDIGTTVGDFVPGPHALFALDQNNIWAATDLGNVHFSSDGGLTWSALESNVITDDPILAIRFVDDLVGWFAGENNIVAKTVDGGISWSVVTGPSGQTTDEVNVIEPLDRNRAWIGFSDGNLYFTLDGGVTWTARGYSGSGVGQIKDIHFHNEYCGFMLSNTAAPVGRVVKTIDGGYTWQVITTPTNAGLNDLHVCDEWSFYAVGEAYQGTGVIMKGAVV